jgi:hypothetical protein
MEADDPAGSAALRWFDPAMDVGTGSGAEAAVGALYRAQAVGLIRLAYLMLGDRAGGRGRGPGRLLRAIPALGPAHRPR